VFLKQGLDSVPIFSNSCRTFNIDKLLLPIEVRRLGNKFPWNSQGILKGTLQGKMSEKDGIGYRGGT